MSVVKMPYTKQIELGGLVLQCRLGGRQIINVEKRLGKSLMALFMGRDGGMSLPPTNELLIVLQEANQVSGVTSARILEAFDKYLDDGHTTMDLLQDVQELLEESGFFGKEKNSKESVKKEETVDLDSTPMEDELI